MKKKALLVSVSLLAIVNTAFPFSYTYQGKTLYYYISISNGQAVVTMNSYSNYSGDIIIPSSVTYNGNTYSVTSIDFRAFDGCSGLTSITIPNSVTSIGNYAFRGCIGLTSVTIPNSVTSIGDDAFRNCSGLTSVIFNADSCISAGSSNYPVFYGCSNLTNIIFGNNVRYIPSYLCYGCSGLTSITIPNSVTSIDFSAFDGCSGLTSVTIPNNVTSIGGYAFCDCSGLTSVIFNADSCISASSMCPVFYGCSNLTNIIFGNNVRYIPSCLCYGCSGLTSITIPNSVTSIGDAAFSGCSGLTSVIIGGNVTSIGVSAFYDCSGLASVTIPNSVISIDYGAFRGCSDLTSVTIPNSVTSIGDYAFDGCSGLTSVTIGSGVTSIGDYAFRGYSGLTSVIFNADSCISAGSLNCPVFYGCSNLTNIIFGNNVRYIPSYLCYGRSGLTSITIPNNVTSIGDYAFRGCSGLSTVYMMPVTPPTLGYEAFSGNASGRVFILTGCSYDDYYNASSWYNYGTALRGPIIDFIVNVQSSNSTRGTVNVVLGQGNIVRCDSTVVVRATANSGYYFDRWSNGSTANPDTLILTGDTTITAYFIGLMVTSNDPVRGSASHTKIGDHLEKITATANSLYHFERWSTNSTTNPDTITLTGDSTITAYFIGLTVTSSDPARGSASHTKIGDNLEKITATANSHYHFVRWSTNSTTNPDTITLTGDSTITAYFERNSYNLTVNVNDATLGSVATPQGSSALYQDTLMVVATPTAHYHVASWQGAALVSATKDTSWVKMTDDITVTCNFAIDTHTVDVLSSNIARGSVTGGGEFVYGTPCTVEATAYSGYTFVSWSNGATYNPYTFAVLEDVELTAIFLAPDEITYTITVESNDPTMGTATVNGNSTATVINGDSVTITATAFNGYRFVRWNDNDTHAVRTVTVTADATYTAYFESMMQGIADVDEGNIMIYVVDARIHVSIDGKPVEEFRVYDLMGRKVFYATHADGTSALPGGVYLVKVDALPARKVVVIR